MQNKSKIMSFLDTLTDHELANFYYYKYDTFMEHSKKEIDVFFSAKGITQEKIIELMKENRELEHCNKKNQCPQCYSTKKIKTQELFCPWGFGVALDAHFSDNTKMTDLYFCLICGYDFYNCKPIHKKYSRIVSFFKKFYDFD